MIYEIYVRSFADGNGDGIGDLTGLRVAPAVPARPRRRRDLADAVLHARRCGDGGYDVADYRDVDPRVGTLADFDAMVDRRARRGHPGDRRHRPQPLLVRAPVVPGRRSPPGPVPSERDRYIFRPSGPDGGPPNDWQSVFGGAAWTQIADGRVVPAPVRHLAAGLQLGERARCAPSSSRSCGSGWTAASTASASTWPTAWSRPKACRRSAALTPACSSRPRCRTGTRTRCTRSTAAGGRSSTPTRATGWPSPRRGCPARSGWPATSARTS